jgi:hypothetical protein
MYIFKIFVDNLLYILIIIQKKSNDFFESFDLSLMSKRLFAIRFDTWLYPYKHSLISLNSSMMSFTCTILLIRYTLSPQNKSPLSISPFAALIKACVIQ